MQRIIDEITSELNERQLEAVKAVGKPLLILAGAGTGKTRVLTSKISYLVASGLSNESEILAVTFSNRAANEMKQRIGFSMRWVGTFHSCCSRILRIHGELIGIKNDFIILNQDDQIKLIKQIIKDENLEDKKDLAQAVLEIISRWKDAALNCCDITPEMGIEQRAHYIYQIYQDRLRTYGAVDFGDLILLNIELFRTNDQILEYYQNKFKYILVDEYQDTNIAQYLWLRMLSPKGEGLCCVGDDDQSIYSWRGAEVGNILRFSKDFENAVTIRLEQNYRSTQHILSAADGVISHNQGRLGKRLWSSKGDGEKIVVQGVFSSRDESIWVAQNILSKKNLGLNFEEIAILIRAGFQARELEEKLIAWGVPYRVIGGPKFYDRQEIRDIVAYLRVIYQPDDGLALERIINTPRRGIGQSTIQALRHIVITDGVNYSDALEKVKNHPSIRPSAKKSIEIFSEDLKRWNKLMLSGVLALNELVKTILLESGYEMMLKQSKDADSKNRLENIKELTRSLTYFSSIEEFLEHISLVSDNSYQKDESDLVTLMTLHSAKGQEFDTVYLCGWEEGVFPNPISLQEDNLEEERRLAYVGITRAKKSLTITHASKRLTYNQWQSSLPSRFIAEIPKCNMVEYDTGQFYQKGAGNFYQQNFKPSGYEAMALKTKTAGTGAKVRHKHYGEGVVLSVSPTSVEVDFDDFGVKKMLPDFLEEI